MRREERAISDIELLALENKHVGLSHPGFGYSAHSYSYFPPSTPPTTPHINRTRSAAPTIRSSHRTNTVDKRPGHLRSRSSLAPDRCDLFPSVSPVFDDDDDDHFLLLRSSHFRPLSSEWTNHVRNAAGQLPNLNHGYPISPPSSTEFAPTEQFNLNNLRNYAHMEVQEDCLAPPLSLATETSSIASQQTSVDEVYSSTASSSWGVDQTADLYDLDHKTWDYSDSNLLPLTTSISSHNTTGSHYIPQQPQYDHTPENLSFNTTTTTASTGLGIDFPNTDFGSQPQIYHSTNVIRPLDAHLNILSSSVDFTSIPFNTPVSDFVSPTLLSDHSTINYNPTDNIHNGYSPSPPLSSMTMARQNPSPPTPRQHQRNKSSLSSTSTRGRGRTPRAAKTGKDGSTGGIELGFVNLTPEDRNKLLTGVAPSGSSKTKARREKEALDRRRKLSEAAKRLVSEAGGDVDAVDRELSD